MFEPPAHYHCKFIHKGRLETGETILRHANQRRGDGLVRPAFRRKRHARRRGDEHEAGILIAGMVERIEAAFDERVV